MLRTVPETIIIVQMVFYNFKKIWIKHKIYLKWASSLLQNGNISICLLIYNTIYIERERKWSLGHSS